MDQEMSIMQGPQGHQVGASVHFPIETRKAAKSLKSIVRAPIFLDSLKRPLFYSFCSCRYPGPRRAWATAAWRLRAKVHLDITTSTHHNVAMRTTLTLDDDVYEAAAQLSRVSGKRLGKVVSTLARRSLTRSERPQRRRGRKFPTFWVPAGPV